MNDYSIVLNDLFPYWMADGGFLTVLTNNFDVPWSEVVEGSILDLEYHGNRSGEKVVAPLLVHLMNNDGSGISDAQVMRLASLVFLRFNQNWDKLWKTFSFEYNPLNNYTMNESGYYDLDSEGDGTNQNNINGFNSSSSVPHDDTVMHNEGEEHNRHGYSREGNTGFYTPQQLIEKERSVWLWNFFETVFRDLDKILVTDIYGKIKDHLTIIQSGYKLPIAGSILGGVKSLTKPDTATQRVYVDEYGYMWWIPQEHEKELPEVTEEDDGDFLRVVDGVWSKATIYYAGGEEF